MLAIIFYLVSVPLDLLLQSVPYTQMDLSS